MLVLTLGFFLVGIGLLNEAVRKPLFLVSVVLLGLIFALNSQNQDYEAYQTIFDNPGDYAEMGYSALVFALKELGAESHRSVQVVLSFLVMGFFLYAGRFIRYSVMLIGFYIAFPGPLDVIQIRNTFSTFLFLYSLLFYVDDKPKTSLLMICASMAFHMFGLTYAVIYLVARIRNKFLQKYSVLLGFLVFSSVMVLYLPVLIQSGYFRTLEFYVADGFKVSSIVFWGGMTVADLFAFNFLKTHLNLTCNERFVSVFFGCILASLMFVVGLGFLYDLNRLYRAIFVIKLLLGTYLLSKLSKKIKYGSIAYLAISTVCIFSYYDDVLDFDWVYFG